MAEIISGGVWRRGRDWLSSAEVSLVMSRAVAILCTLAVGGVVALQPPANAARSRHVGDLGAAFISVSISMAAVGIVLLVAGHPGHLRGLSAFRPEYAVGGLAGAAVVTVSL